MESFRWPGKEADFVMSMRSLPACFQNHLGSDGLGFASIFSHHDLLSVSVVVLESVVISESVLRMFCHIFIFFDGDVHVCTWCSCLRFVCRSLRKLVWCLRFMLLVVVSFFVVYRVVCGCLFLFDLGLCFASLW